MECNRDEAVRARDIAEMKYAKQDFVGAKKFVLKAQQLFPTLEGLSQMLQVLEVHSVAQIKLGGTEMDWYGILQVDPGADDSTIKKQYRRLALLLHPDKNKAVGAESAFKLIGEAWGILSDKTKRTLHDIKRGGKTTKSHVRVMEANVQNFQTPFTTGPTTTPTPPQTNHTPPTFWTACPSCKMQYQYLRTYENYQLQCPKCKNVFLARDIHAAVNNNGSGGYAWHYDGQRQDFSFNKQPVSAAEFNGAAPGHTAFMDGTFFANQASNATFFSSAAAAAAAQSKVAAAAAAAAAASSAVPNNLAADVVNQTYAKVKRERVEAEKETKRKEKELRRKEKDELRKEKEDQRKAREAERSKEAMESLIAKRRERIARDESKRKGDARAGRKLRRKKRSSDQEDDEELEDEDPKPYQPGLQDDLSSPVLPRRRSARAKNKITTYKVDSDEDSDSDSEDFPAPKRAKLDGEASAEDPLKSEDENGREASKQQSENGTKGKSPGDDSYHAKRSDGANGGKQSDGRRHVTERNRDDHGSTPKKDSSNSNFVETSRRESKLHDSPSTLHKARVARSSLPESQSPARGPPHKGDLKDEKSPSKSPRILRIRVKSPKVFGSQSVSYEDQIPQQRVSSPLPSVPSTPTSDEQEQEQEFEGEDNQIHVPDPDFHDFDSNRTEKDILPGQVWAIYDDQDGMPRYYGRISKVSTQPFKAHACWLEHCSSSESDDKWTDTTGLSITCGEFKIGKSTIMDQINTFSHMVLEKSGGRGLLKIYPKNGQVWAVYRYSDSERMSGQTKVSGPNGQGNAQTYDMVEVIHDFTEGKSLIAGRLEKVEGYKTLFRRVDGADSEWLFEQTELARFSHNVPNQQFPDKEADEFGIPRGCLELDPASTPLELIDSASDPF